MSVTVDLRSEHRERTREAILDAAWELAAEGGIAGLSLRELARRVGMRAPSLYSYFPAKAAIYDAMFVEGHEALDERLRDLPVDGEPVAVATAGLVDWLRFCLESIPRYQLLFTHAVPGWSPSTEAYAAAIASYERMRTNLARVGVTEQRHLDLWTALASGLAAQQIANEPTTERWTGLAEDAVRMLLAHTAGDGGDRRTA